MPELPEDIGEFAEGGDFERVKAWLAGGTASAPRSVNDGDITDWTLLMWTARTRDTSLEHVEFARYLLSQGAQVNARKRALEFVVRQGDNGIVWHILSYWRETG